MEEWSRFCVTSERILSRRHKVTKDPVDLSSRHPSERSSSNEMPYLARCGWTGDPLDATWFSSPVRTLDAHDWECEVFHPALEPGTLFLDGVDGKHQTQVQP